LENGVRITDENIQPALNWGGRKKLVPGQTAGKEVWGTGKKNAKLLTARLSKLSSAEVRGTQKVQ